MEGYNTKRLAKVLSNRMKDTTNASRRTIIELGTYNENGSITPDSLRTSIPKGQYMINFMLADDTFTSADTVSISGGEHAQKEGSGYHEHNEVGEHTHKIPKKLFPLTGGDRILIAWCGNEPVVIAKVTRNFQEGE